MESLIFDNLYSHYAVDAFLVRKDGVGFSLDINVKGTVLYMNYCKEEMKIWEFEAKIYDEISRVCKENNILPRN